MENLTFMEPMASRQQEEVVMALSKIHARSEFGDSSVSVAHRSRKVLSHKGHFQVVLGQKGLSDSDCK